jgi:hypothetical protein
MAFVYQAINELAIIYFDNEGHVDEWWLLSEADATSEFAGPIPEPEG